MRIFSVNTFNNQNNTHNINNKKGRINSFGSLYAPLRLNEHPCDTVTFTAQIPYKGITMDRLVEKTVSTDLSRHKILSLADRYNIPCPVCGKLLYGVAKSKAFEKRVEKSYNTAELLEAIRPDKKYLHNVEKQVYEMFLAEHAKSPKKSLINILREKLHAAEPYLIQKQSAIFLQIQYLNKECPTKHSKDIQDLIFDSYSRIFDPRKTSRFSRKVFLDKLSHILTDADDIVFKVNMLAIASKLPTSSNDLGAFIVKYAKRNYKNSDPNRKIALRMLHNSLVTEEHSIARSKGGEDIPANIALECACDNNAKGSNDILTQVFENPDMIVNYPKYVEKMYELHEKIGISKSFILGNYKIYNEESGGLLNIPQKLKELLLEGTNDNFEPPLDLPIVEEARKALIKVQEPQLSFHKTKSSNTEKSGITPTKAERRAARKEKLKQKKQFKPDKKRVKYTDSRFDRRN